MSEQLYNKPISGVSVTPARLLSEEEIAAIHRLHTNLYGSGSAIVSGGFAEFADRTLNKSNRLMFLARDEQNRVVGTAHCSTSQLKPGGLVSIGGFVVDEKRRGVRIGSELLLSVVEHFRAAGVPRILMKTSNPIVRNIAERVGFRAVGEFKRSRNANVEHVTTLMFEYGELH